MSLPPAVVDDKGLDQRSRAKDNRGTGADSSATKNRTSPQHQGERPPSQRRSRNRGTPGARSRKKSQSGQHDNIERTWAAKHPEGRTTDGQNNWVLWNFNVGDGRLKPEHMRKLDEIALRLPGAALHRLAPIKILGHASQSGPERLNTDLSAWRAGSVVDYLVRAFSGSPTGRGITDRIVMDNYGSSNPFRTDAAIKAAKNSEVAGLMMAENRRVEVRVEKAPSPPPPIRKTLPTPTKPEPTAPEQQKQNPKGVSSEFSFKIPLPDVPIPLADFATLYPKGSLLVKVKLNGPARSKVALERDLKGLKVKFEQELAKDVSVEGTTKGELALKLKGQPTMYFPFDTTQFKWEKEHPFRVTGTVKMGVWKRSGKFLGYDYEMTVEPEVGVGIEPGPGFARVARIPGGGVAAGFAAGAMIAGLTYMSTVYPHQEGERIGRQSWFTSSYAYRMAALLQEDDTRAFNGYIDRVACPRTAHADEASYEQSWQGWMAADAAIKAMQTGELAAFKQALKQRYGAPARYDDFPEDRIIQKITSSRFKFNPANPWALVQP